MVSLSVAVMAHPKREAMVDELLDRLDRPAKVTWDEINDRHDTGIRAIEAFDPACSHHLIIQDDIIPSGDMIAGAERALKYIPQDVPVSLYVGKVRPFGKVVQRAVEAAGDTASWITMAGIYWGPAVILPTHTIEPMAAFYRSSKVTNYDRRMSTWFQRQRLRCWYSWPSLVDHRGDESLVKGHGTGRHAHRFHDGSALDVDWSGPVVDLGNTDNLDRTRQARAERAARATGVRGVSV